MRFLVDQQLPRKLADFVRARGHEVQHVKDLAMAAADDRDIWREAARLGAVIISKDEDFGLISATSGSPQVVWVRTGNCSNALLLSRFEQVWDRLMVELEAGTALVELR